MIRVRRTSLAIAFGMAAAAPPLTMAPAALEQAARSGEERALKQIFEFYVNRGDEKNALYWLDEGVMHDLPDALLLRSTLLLEENDDSEGSLVDAKRAFEAAKKRAKRGEAYYQLMLGRMYQTGAKGACPVDEKEALRWIRMAAAQDFPAARAMLTESTPPSFDQEQEAAFRKEETTRARQFIAGHPDIAGGDGRSEETAYTVRLMWPDCNPLIEEFLACVYPDSYPTVCRTSRTSGNRQIRRQSLVDRNGRKIDVYFNYPNQPNPYDET